MAEKRDNKEILEMIENWLEDLEDNGLPAQCSLRVEMKAKDELGFLGEMGDDV